jgi:hypothetical protein
MQEHIYEQKQKEESRKESIRSAKCKSAKKLEEFGGTGFINSVAPSFPESAKVEKISQISQDKLFLIQDKRRLSKYSL